MKKILSLLLLAFIGVNVASAQVTATCNGQEVKDGDEIVYYAHADDFGEISINPENQGKDILFRSADGSKVAFKVNAQFPAEAIAKDLFTWCVGTQCSAPKVDDTRDVTVNSILVTALGIHSNALAVGQYVDYPVQITVRKGMTTLFRFTVRFVYSAETLNKEMNHVTGIGSTTVQAQSVKFNGQALVYHFNSNAARQLNVYGTDGKLVKTAALTAADGQLSLAGMPKGVYVFNLTEGNATLQSGKVVLK